MVFNGAQYHMWFNHLPVVGFVGITLALFAALLMKRREVQVFVLLASVVVGLSALPSYWTGEPAEEVIEDMSGVSKKLIHEHEELAEKATVLSVVTALVAAGVYIWQRRRPQHLTQGLGLVLLLALANLLLLGWTAHEGGVIRHPELLPQSASPEAAPNAPTHED